MSEKRLDDLERILYNLERIGAEVLIEKTKKYLEACWAHRDVFYKDEKKHFVDIIALSEKIHSHIYGYGKSRDDEVREE